MKEFTIPRGDVKVIGQTMDVFLAAMGPYRARGEKLMARNCGVEQLDPAAGPIYPMSGWLESLKELQHQFGADFMKKVGSFVFEKAAFPPSIDSLGSAMAMVDIAYRINHGDTKADIGHYLWKPNDRGGTMCCDNPYPCGFDFGIVLGILKRFAPEAKATHLNPEVCRHTGGDSCTYLVEV